MAEQMRHLVQTRGQVKAHFTRFRIFLEDFNHEQGIIALETRLSKIEPLFERFDEIQSKIETMSQDDEGALEACQEERNQFKTLYFDLLTQARTLLQVKNPRVLIHNDVNNAIIEPQLGVKLPVIKLSTFDDSYER